MRQLKIVCFVLLATAVISPKARAAGIFTDTCNVVPVAFNGLNFSPGTCILGVGSTGIQGLATATLENIAGGLDFFHEGIGMIYDTSGFDQLQAGGYTISVSTNTTWSPLPVKVPTFLGLTGRVQIPDPTGTINIVLTGLLGGAVSTITVNLDHNNCAQCTLAIPLYKDQLQFASATETLTIKSVGRTVYRTNSPEFDGSTPEPGTFLLMGAGLYPLLHIARRRSK